MPRSTLVDQCSRRDTLLILGDFIASTCTDGAGYETCVGPHGSGILNQKSSKFLDFGWLVPVLLRQELSTRDTSYNTVRVNSRPTWLHHKMVTVLHLLPCQIFLVLDTGQTCFAQDVTQADHLSNAISMGLSIRTDNMGLLCKN